MNHYCSTPGRNPRRATGDNSGPYTVITLELGSQPALLASRERSSGELVFPPLPENSPLAARHELTAIETTGMVYSFSVIHPNPKTGQAPYALGYVDLPGPVRIFGRHRRGRQSRGRFALPRQAGSRFRLRVRTRCTRSASMKDVYFAGAAMTPFGRHTGVLAPELAQQAILRAMDDAGVQPRDIQAIYCANVLGGMILGQVDRARSRLRAASRSTTSRTPAPAAPPACTWRATRCSPNSTTRCWCSASSS